MPVPLLVTFALSILASPAPERQPEPGRIAAKPAPERVRCVSTEVTGSLARRTRERHTNAERRRIEERRTRTGRK